MTRTNSAAPRLILGLTGYKRTGKDTAAAILLDMIPGARRFAFADQLRAEIAQNFGGLRGQTAVLTNDTTKEQTHPFLSLTNCKDRNFVEYALSQIVSTDTVSNTIREPRSPRQIMQLWGSYRRQSATDYWVLALEAEVKLADLDDDAPPPIAIIITDCRYANEAKWVLSHDGYIARVVRAAANTAANTAALLDGHESEGGEAFPYAQFALDNSGTRHDLHIQIQNVLRELTIMQHTAAAQHLIAA